MTNSSVFDECPSVLVTHTREYFQSRIPDTRDDKITAVLREWIALSAEERSEAKRHISGPQFAALYVYGHRMASRAVRERDSELVFFGLLGTGLHARAWRSDSRDVLYSLSMLHHSSQLLGCSPSKEFVVAAGYLDHDVAREFRAFAKRRPEDASIERFFIKAGRDADGFLYEPDPPGSGQLSWWFRS